MTVLASPLVDTGALWKIVLIALGGSVAVGLLFGVVVVAGSRAWEERSSRRAWAPSASVAAVALLLCLAAAALGIVAMTHK